MRRERFPEMNSRFFRRLASAHWMVWMLLLAAGPGLAAAGAPPGAPVEALPKGRIAFRSYGTQQGLNNLAPSLLLQDRLGYIWVGTEDGLYRYDGQRFQTFDRRMGLPSTYITALHEDLRGTLWAGTYQGLARYDGSRFAAVPEEAGLPNVPIEGITSDRSNQVWAATPRGLFLSRNGQTWGLAQGWPGGAATAVLARPGAMKVWAAEWRESKGQKEAVVHEWDAGHWRVYGRAGGLWTDRIDDFAEDANGWVWARTRRELDRIPGRPALLARIRALSESGTTITSPRRVSSKSISTSGICTRSGFRNRSKVRPYSTGSISVISTR